MERPPDGPYGSNYVVDDDDEEPPHDLKVDRFYKVNSLIRREDCTELLKLALEPDPVNLMNDPLLSVVITDGKTGLALRLIQELPEERLSGVNFNRETALHVAATVGDCQVAKALLNRDPFLVRKRNKKQETPLHKAALYGRRNMFWCLLRELPENLRDDENLREDDLANMRREDGATMLHCAIMGNAPALALEIARVFPALITSRNDNAVTPLQLMVTIPEAFRSQLVLGPLDELLYKCIPVQSDDSADRKYTGRDEEKAHPASTKPITDVDGDGAVRHPSPKPLRSKFPSQYDVLFDLFELVFHFPVSSRVQDLEKKKNIHRQVMDLVEHLALHPKYFDFITKGRTAKNDSFNLDSPDRSPDVGKGHHQPSDGLKRKLSRIDYYFLKMLQSYVEDEEETAEATRKVKEMIRSGREFSESLRAKESGRRWDEPPLTLGASMGLDEYVIKIIEAYPQSATLRDTEGRSVLQVAIMHGRTRIVRFIKKKFQEKNPILPSWLLSSVDRKTKNTILHMASEKVIDEHEDDALKLQEDLKWFELIRGMVPQELVNSRNAEDKTAQEAFTENHKEMLRRCKLKMIEMAKTCIGLVAAVVFASSFSIPGDKDSEGNPKLSGTLAFEVFSRAYPFGVSCAATSLVLFLSLLISPYEEQQFRRAIPTKYFFAVFSFGMAMAALLWSFTCNVFLQLHGRRMETWQVLEMGLELNVFPVVTILFLLYRGCSFGFFSFRTWTLGLIH